MGLLGEYRRGGLTEPDALLRPSQSRFPLQGASPPPDGLHTLNHNEILSDAMRTRNAELELERSKRRERRAKLGLPERSGAKNKMSKPSSENLLFPELPDERRKLKKQAKPRTRDNGKRKARTRTEPEFAPFPDSPGKATSAADTCKKKPTGTPLAEPVAGRSGSSGERVKKRGRSRQVEAPQNRDFAHVERPMTPESRHTSPSQGARQRIRGQPSPRLRSGFTPQHSSRSMGVLPLNEQNDSGLSTPPTSPNDETAEALAEVFEAERHRQRFLKPRYISSPRQASLNAVAPHNPLPNAEPPKDEYTLDDETPPYCALLHKYLDLVSYDERFSPCLRVNRYLVTREEELNKAIDKLTRCNLLPTRTNLWHVSHVDDNDYERVIPALIGRGR